jgi:RNA recognition motif-containing protein
MSSSSAPETRDAREAPLALARQQSDFTSTAGDDTEHAATALDPADAETPLNLLVAGLTRDVDDDTLRHMFEPFGEIRSTIVMLKANTATSRGFGFVLFARQDEAVRAMEALNNTKIGPNTLNIRPSTHDGHVEERDAIFVRNIPKEVGVQPIQAAIESVAAPVVSIHLMPGSTSSVSNATIIMGSVEAARRAVTTLHGMAFLTLYEKLPNAPPLYAPPYGRPPIPAMLVKFAEPDETRRRRYITTRLDRQRRSSDHPTSAAHSSSDAAPPRPVPAPHDHHRHHSQHYPQQSQYSFHGNGGQARAAAPPTATVPVPMAFSFQTPTPAMPPTMAYPFVPQPQFNYHTAPYAYHTATMLPAATTLPLGMPIPYASLPYGVLPVGPPGFPMPHFALPQQQPISTPFTASGMLPMQPSPQAAPDLQYGYYGP